MKADMAAAEVRALGWGGGGVRVLLTGDAACKGWAGFDFGGDLTGHGRGDKNPNGGQDFCRGGVADWARHGCATVQPDAPRGATPLAAPA